MNEPQLHNFLRSLPTDVRMVAVSKYHTVEEMLSLYRMGVRCFAESRSKELLQKQATFAEMGINDIEWHFIGHLQTNKVKDVIGRVSLIQSVDSQRLLEKIELLQGEVASRRLQGGEDSIFANPVQSILLELKIAQEDTKHGFTADGIHEIMANQHLYPHLQICGLMGMATQTDNKTLVLNEFQCLYSVFKQYQSPTFNTLSAGISEDYPLAIQAGSNMIRIGSMLFE